MFITATEEENQDSIQIEIYFFGGRDWHWKGLFPSEFPDGVTEQRTRPLGTEWSQGCWVWMRRQEMAAVIKRGRSGREGRYRGPNICLEILKGDHGKWDHHQRWAERTPWAEERISMLHPGSCSLASVNKALLGHGHICSLTHCLQLLPQSPSLSYRGVADSVTERQ